MAEDLTVETLIEFRSEMREFREETRKSLVGQDHRLNLVSAQLGDQAKRLAQLETHLAALLATMPHVHTRIDDLADRLAAVEERLARMD